MCHTGFSASRRTTIFRPFRPSTTHEPDQVKKTRCRPWGGVHSPVVGLRITIRRSKTDQEGAGAVVAVCRGSIACPVAVVKEWLAAANIVEGPIFRQVGKGGRLLPGQLSPQNLALIVKAYAKRLGLDP